jgi:hypothetical protein
MTNFSITVSGPITNPMFFKAVSIGRALERLHYDSVKVEYHQFFETQWSEFLKKTANELKGVFYEHDEKEPLVYINGSEYVGSADQFG